VAWEEVILYCVSDRRALGPVEETTEHSGVNW
jgi:hypothetical protein